MRKRLQEGRLEDTSYRDLITIALVGFVMIAVLLLTFLNPPAIEDTPATDTGIQFEISWPVELDIDVDLWVQAPNERAVGYSNLGSGVLNLQRDDLGSIHDFGYSNHETTRSRGFVPGPYIVNIHLYSARSPIPEGGVPVALRISHEEIGRRTIRLFMAKRKLTHAGQEITAVRFTLNEAGFIDKASINFIPKRLRVGAG